MDWLLIKFWNKLITFQLQKQEDLDMTWTLFVSKQHFSCAARFMLQWPATRLKTWKPLIMKNRKNEWKITTARHFAICCIPQWKKCMNIFFVYIYDYIYDEYIHIYVYIYIRYLLVVYCTIYIDMRICIHGYALYHHDYVLPLYHLPVRPEGMWKRGVWTSWPFLRTTRKQGKHPMVMCWCGVSGGSLGRLSLPFQNFSRLTWQRHGPRTEAMDDINVKALAINDLVILCRAYCDTASDLMIQGVQGDVGWAWTMFVFQRFFHTSSRITVYKLICNLEGRWLGVSYFWDLRDHPAFRTFSGMPYVCQDPTFPLASWQNDSKDISVTTPEILPSKTPSCVGNSI